MLHANIISKIRVVLGKVLESKNRVVILIDNLDKAWEQKENIVLLSDLLFGLLSVTRRIIEDFRKSDQRRRPANLALILFLRSDIFSYIMKGAREKDKISYSRITWHDPKLLIRVLEERFLSSGVPNP